MPSAYCVVYAKDGAHTYVLVATKSDTAANNRSQVVYPGGHMNCSKLNKPTETVTAAATREFQEETGVAISATQIVPPSIAVISMESYRFNYSYSYVDRQNHLRTVQDFYGATYVRVSSAAELNALSEAININIRSGVDKYKELASTSVMDLPLAIAAFTTEDVPANSRLRTEWFAAISKGPPLQ